MKDKLNNDLYRTLVLTLLAGVAVVSVALANRNVYTMDEVDQRMGSLRALNTIEHDSINQRIDVMSSDVRWLVRERGGTPYADAEQSNNPSQ